MDHTASDVFQQLIERAVETGVRKALNVNDATNRRLFSVDEVAVYLELVQTRDLQHDRNTAELAAVTCGRRKMLDIKDLDVVDQSQ